jgi:hypothetical protein
MQPKKVYPESVSPLESRDFFAIHFAVCGNRQNFSCEGQNLPHECPHGTVFAQKAPRKTRRNRARCPATRSPSPGQPTTSANSSKSPVPGLGPTALSSPLFSTGVVRGWVAPSGPARHTQAPPGHDSRPSETTWPMAISGQVPVAPAGPEAATPIHLPTNRASPRNRATLHPALCVQGNTSKQKLSMKGQPRLHPAAAVQQPVLETTP